MNSKCSTGLITVHCRTGDKCHTMLFTFVCKIIIYNCMHIFSIMYNFQEKLIRWNKRRKHHALPRICFQNNFQQALPWIWVNFSILMPFRQYHKPFFCNSNRLLILRSQVTQYKTNRCFILVQRPNVNIHAMRRIVTKLYHSAIIGFHIVSTC